MFERTEQPKKIPHLKKGEGNMVSALRSTIKNVRLLTDERFSWLVFQSPLTECNIAFSYRRTQHTQSLASILRITFAGPVEQVHLRHRQNNRAHHLGIC